MDDNKVKWTRKVRRYLRLPLVRCPKTGANRVWLQLCRCLVHLESLCLEKLICLL